MADGELPAEEATVGQARRPDVLASDRVRAWLGDGRFFALGKVTSDEPFLIGHQQWPWALEVTILAEVPLLSRAPKLGDVGIEGRPLSRQVYIKMSEEQGRRAERLIFEAAR